MKNKERDRDKVDVLWNLSGYMQCYRLQPGKCEFMLKYDEKNVWVCV